MANEDKALEGFDNLGIRFFNANLWLSAIRGLFFLSDVPHTRRDHCLVLFPANSVWFGWQHLNGADFVSLMWIQASVYAPVSDARMVYYPSINAAAPPTTALWPSLKSPGCSGRP